MYYIYGRVRAIPTYRVYRLYDNLEAKLHKYVTIGSSPLDFDFLGLLVECIYIYCVQCRYSLNVDVVLFNHSQTSLHYM